MRKCSVCGRRFRLLAKNRYEVVKKPVGLNCLTEDTVYYNAFDCPHCGCQNIVGVLEKVIVKDIEDEVQPQAESKENVCEDCYYNDGEAHAECVICGKAESEVNTDG